LYQIIKYQFYDSVKFGRVSIYIPVKARAVLYLRSYTHTKWIQYSVRFNKY